MIARLTSQALLPDHRHADVAEHMALEVPEAPPELFYCLDLSRFLGD